MQRVRADRLELKFREKQRMTPVTSNTMGVLEPGSLVYVNDAAHGRARGVIEKIAYAPEVNQVTFWVILETGFRVSIPYRGDTEFPLEYE